MNKGEMSLRLKLSDMQLPVHQIFGGFFVLQQRCKIGTKLWTATVTELLQNSKHLRTHETRSETYDKVRWHPSFYLEAGSIIDRFLWIWSIPLTNDKWHSDPRQTVSSQPIRLSTNLINRIPSLTFTELWVVSMEHLQRVWHVSRERVPFRTPGSVPLFGTCLCPIVETRFLELAMSLLDFHFEYPLVLSRVCFSPCQDVLNVFRPWKHT